MTEKLLKATLKPEFTYTHTHTHTSEYVSYQYIKMDKVPMLNFSSEIEQSIYVIFHKKSILTKSADTTFLH